MPDIVEFPSKEPKKKTWVETVQPQIRQWKLRAMFPALHASVSSEEAWAIQQDYKLMAEQIDDYKITIDKLHRLRFWSLKWGTLIGIMIGWGLAQLLSYP